jgi:hypothetical protein
MFRPATQARPKQKVGLRPLVCFARNGITQQLLKNNTPLSAKKQTGEGRFHVR